MVAVGFFGGVGVFQGLGDLRFELWSLGGKLLIGERLYFGLERVNLRDERHDALDIALVLGADEAGHYAVEEYVYTHEFSGEWLTASD